MYVFQEAHEGDNFVDAQVFPLGIPGRVCDVSNKLIFL